jgi:hypothetical protein
MEYERSLQRGMIVVAISENQITYHYSVEQKLKEHGIAYHRKHNVERSAKLLAVFWENEILVTGVHSDQRDQKGQIPNHIIDESVQSTIQKSKALAICWSSERKQEGAHLHNDPRGRKGIQSVDLRPAIQDPRNGGESKDNNVGTTSRIRAKVRRQEDLVVAWNITGQERPEKRGEDTLTEDILEWIKDQFVGSERKLAVTAGFFVKCACYTLFKFAVGIGHVPSIEAKIVKMNHQLEIF